MIIGRYDFSTANTKPTTSSSQPEPAEKPQGVGTGAFSDVLSGMVADKNKLDELQASVDTAKKSGDDAKIRKASEDFEAVFLNMMFKQMRNTIGESGLIEKSYGRGVYEDLYYEELAKNIAKGNGYGLGEFLYKDMIRSQGSGDKNKE